MRQSSMPNDPVDIVQWYEDYTGEKMLYSDQQKVKSAGLTSISDINSESELLPDSEEKGWLDFDYTKYNPFNWGNSDDQDIT